MATATVKRRQLGNELRHLRQRAELDAETAGDLIERSQSMISRLEHGATGIKQRDLRHLLEKYAERIGETLDYEWYAELNRGAEQTGRWSGYRSEYPKYFRLAVDLEVDATELKIYQTELIHGLLQTESYMRELFNMNQLRAVDQGVERVIRARLERQQMLTKPDAPEVTIVLSESGLRRKIGGAETMRDQLNHLANLARQPNLHLHVHSFDAPAPAGIAFPFVYYRVPAASNVAPPLEFIFEETFTDGEYLDQPELVANYNRLWSGLLGAALDEVQSRKLLLQVAKQFQ